MKKINSLIGAIAVCLLANANIYAETIHQTVKGEAAYTGEGGSALTKKQIEVKNVPDKGTVARVVGSLNQWGYVNFWFGLPVPAGKSVLRFKVYVEDGDTAEYAIYISNSAGDPIVTKLIIPADAPKNSVVTVDVPVDVPAEWGGFAFKKMVTDNKPSIWIESISAVLP